MRSEINAAADRTWNWVNPFRWLKYLLPHTLFGRSLMIIATPVVLAQAIATFVFYDRHWETMTRRLAAGLAGEVAMIIELLDRVPAQQERADLLALANRTMGLEVTWEPGASLPEEPRKLSGILERMMADALDSRVGLPSRVRSGERQKWIEARVALPDGVLTVVAPFWRLFSFTSYLFIAWMVGSSLVLSTIAIVFMRNQTRPIRRLAIAADAFGKGRDAPGFKPEGALEVRQAAHAFLIMRERIQRQIQQRTDMLAGVSHDLRTPLTRMKLELAMMPDSEGVNELKADVADMETMIEGYLAFARGAGAEQPQPTNMAELLEEVAANARREGAHVELDLGGHAPVLPLRPNTFKRCLSNLVGNARRYGGNVWIGLRQNARAVEVVIDDDGPGITAAQREDVFRPFHRLDASRNPETGGVGLGLTIARDAARGHGGDVLLDDSPRGGLRAIVRLPV